LVVTFSDIVSALTYGVFFRRERFGWSIYPSVPYFIAVPIYMYIDNMPKLASTHRFQYRKVGR